jgi:hypothetical protein
MTAKATVQCRHFYTKEERIAMLEAYKNQLENELLGVNQEIQKMNE